MSVTLPEDVRLSSSAPTTQPVFLTKLNPTPVVPGKQTTEGQQCDGSVASSERGAAAIPWSSSHVMLERPPGSRLDHEAVASLGLG